jgi:hypothetical protein
MDLTSRKYDKINAKAQQIKAKQDTAIRLFGVIQ